MEIAPDSTPLQHLSKSNPKLELIALEDVKPAATRCLRNRCARRGEVGAGDGRGNDSTKRAFHFDDITEIRHLSAVMVVLAIAIHGLYISGALQGVVLAIRDQRATGAAAKHLKGVNAEFARLGYRERLASGDGYFYC